ncbi:hypothetical protein HK107_05905 [Parvularcula sp. ZS-1/3]|uniref:VPLPA-CTERM sorting domain-containing protein n=1 Tax=Parvularcula mediterranea TaxID=2732508 RepID=A0A7Y3RKP9_9PROT|nr:hypothetical protein [Parvularcula mediterranea]NNU15854.1 hypothetical protein [Parvularcula mediterranea]
MKKITALAAALGALTITAAHAASLTIAPDADGTVQVFGGDSVITDDASLNVTQSGGLARNAIFEFDLSGIGDDATITGATFSITLSRFVSNTGGNPAAVDLFAYGGDGVIDISDFGAAGAQVVDTTIPAGGSGGTVFDFTFTDVATLQSLLVSDLLTLRMETDSFASIAIQALEASNGGAASLTINFDVPNGPAIPIPAAAWLFAAGLGGILRFRSKR